MSETVLRWAAVAIALVALIDPSVTLDGRTRPRLSVVVQQGPSMDLPASVQAAGTHAAVTATRAAEARLIRARLRDELGDAFEVVDGLDTAAASVVVVGDRYPEEAIPDSVRASTVNLRDAIAPNVAIASVRVPRAVPPATAVRIGVTVTGTGVRGSTSVMTARLGGAEVGRASHVWTTDDEQWHADLDVVPVGPAPFAVALSVAALPSERTAADNEAVVGVEQAQRLRILVFEARPSWATAFLRRALESDPRFETSGIGQTSPRALVQSGPSPLSPSVLTRADDFDAIVVGGLDRLSITDISALDRYARERGGSVALLPDAKMPVAVSGALTPGIELRETLLERATTLETGSLPRIDASELLEANDSSTSIEILARAPASRRAVVWSMPLGDGHVLVAGGMDAWRYRGEAGVAFDRFWRSVVSGLALAARPAVAITLSPARAASGERVQVTARVRALERHRLADRLAIGARIGNSPLRLWPEAEAGVYSGSFVADRTQAIVIATINDDAVDHPDVRPQSSVRLTVDPHARETAGLPLAAFAESHQGVNVAPQNLANLERHLRDTIPSTSAKTARHPMRSAWWFVAFAACLSGEWWQRRRRGAR